jgi:hypothetical protein
MIIMEVVSKYLRSSLLLILFMEFRELSDEEWCLKTMT